MLDPRPAGRRGLLPARKVDLPFLHDLATRVRVREAAVETFDATHGYTDWRMLGNGPDRTLTINNGNPVGDCFFAAVCHILILKSLVQQADAWVINPDLKTVIEPTANHWVGLYLGFQNQQAPGTVATTGPDQGTEPVAGFQWLTAAGIIKRWGLVAPSKLNDATADHKGVLLACALDADAEQEFANHQPWLNMPTVIDPIDGGHAIARAGFTSRYGLEITWGEDELAARAWENNHIQQAFWLQVPWEDDPTGYDLSPMDAALAGIHV